MKIMPRKEDTVLIADDEPYNLGWVVEFLQSMSYQADIADNVDNAILRLQEFRYRAIIADLSIPVLSPESLIADKEALFQTYPGLLVADYARNHSHTNRQVIVYSVHDDPKVRAVTSKLGVTYLLKGRPRLLKEELKNLLSFDPLAKPVT